MPCQWVWTGQSRHTQWRLCWAPAKEKEIRSVSGTLYILTEYMVFCAFVNFLYTYCLSHCIITEKGATTGTLPRSYSLARHLISCLVPAVIKVNLQLCSHYYLLYFLTNAENLPCIDAPIRPLHTTANTLLHFCHWWFKNVHFFHFSNSVIFWEVHQVVLF